MDRRNFMQQATRFLVGIGLTQLLQYLPQSKSWTKPQVEFHPKFYHAESTIPKHDVPAHVWEMLRHAEQEMDRQTGVMDLETLRRHAPR